MKNTTCRKRKRGNQDYVQDNQQTSPQHIDQAQQKKKSVKAKNDFVTSRNPTPCQKKAEETTKKPSVISSLPPEVKESDKMFSVQRWIENSPLNLPPWVQVTFDKIALLRSTEFPFEEYQLIRLIGKKFKSYSSSNRSSGSSSMGYSSSSVSDGPVINCLDCYYKSNIESPLKMNVLSVLSKMSKEECYFYKSLADTNVSIHGDPKTMGNMTNCPIHLNGVAPNSYSCNPSSSTNDSSNTGTDPYQKRNGAAPMDLSADSCTQSYVQNNQFCQNSSYPNNNANSMSQVTLPARSAYHNMPIGDSQKGGNCAGPPSRNNLVTQATNEKSGIIFNQKQKGNDGYSHGMEYPESGEKSHDRLYNEKDTHLIVKFFNEFFTNGSLPSLQEVRLRLSQTSLGQRRTPISVRAKIKRLQVSGRWNEYLYMV